MDINEEADEIVKRLQKAGEKDNRDFTVEYYISTTEPTTPAIGQMWADVARSRINIFDGISWLEIRGN